MAQVSAPDVLAALRDQCMDHLDISVFPASEWPIRAREEADQALAYFHEGYGLEYAADTLDVVTAGFLADIAANRVVLDREASETADPSTEESTMNVYAYKSALCCEPCGLAIIAQIPDPVADNPADTGDSNDYPQGPYADGGGEADSPQHCDSCNAFLRNPLTWEGEAYARNAARCWRAAGCEASAIIADWSEFYGLEA